MFSMRRIGIFVLVLVIALTVIGCNSDSSSDDEVVAEVGDMKVTKSEFYDELVNQNGAQVLNLLISDKIIEAEIIELEINVADEDIEKDLQVMKDYYSSEDEFNADLTANGLTIDDVKDNIEMNLQVELLLEPYIDITEDEMKEYFEKNKVTLAQEEQVKASHILVDTEELALEVIGKLDAGEAFADLAKEYSTDASNSEQGGNLGYFNRQTMNQEFTDAVFAMKVGQISEPVETEYGYHIISLEDKIEAKEAVYEDSLEVVKDALFEQKLYDGYTAWYTEMLEKYEITTYLE